MILDHRKGQVRIGLHPADQFFHFGHDLVADAVSGQDGDAVLIVADDFDPACAALSALRLHLGRELNLIDTPGHVDFSYEVTRSLAACEGALLLVDASQGVEAQTLANVYQSIEHDHEIVPVINKIDLPAAEPEKVRAEIEEIRGVACSAGTLDQLMEIDHGWCHSLYCVDPNGIMIEFCRDTPGLTPDRPAALAGFTRALGSRSLEHGVRVVGVARGGTAAVSSK